MRSKLKHKDSGMVLALTMIFLVVAVTLAGVMVASGSMGLQQSVNQRESHQARLAAESGLGYIAALVQQIPLAASEKEYFTNVRDGLNSALTGTKVYSKGSTLYVSPVMIEKGEGGIFSAEISKSGKNFLLSVIGKSGETSRTISMEFAANSSAGSKIFENGFLLGGKLQLTGNAKFLGKNSASEARIFSNYTSHNQSFKLTGNVRIAGEMYSANPKGYASISGNASVAGVSSRCKKIWDHIHFGAKPVELPRPDTSIFKKFATNTLSKKCKKNRNKTLTNIYIPPNTNPTFSGNTTINGVVYIASPNKVKFHGNLKITGVIVTEDPGSGKSHKNSLQFSGNTKARGVESLPHKPEFAELRKLPGAAILAPGFSVKFTGNFGTVSGALAAEQFSFRGNAGGIVKGPVISYGNAPFRMSGNARLIIDRSDYDMVPPGFTNKKVALTPVMSTYAERRN
ncbi:MAG: pilus assembly PilX N-terminal domain-containing protein [Phycisphaerae bacterium]|nr:pilus assembly PilX N-terminal domain-containing protein [Phycisphaerae bacterium]